MAMSAKGHKRTSAAVSSMSAKGNSGLLHRSRKDRYSIFAGASE